MQGPSRSSSELRVCLRFIKSFKYKHKRRKRGANRKKAPNKIQFTSPFASCDPNHRQTSGARSIMQAGALPPAAIVAHRRRLIAPATALLLISYCLLIPSKTGAFCPAKCQCNDQLLSANCTRIDSLTIVPMTLNPLLKQLTLSQLQIFDLSNSLSIYRQLEVLQLNSNQLRQIKYENFNFRSPPTSISLNNQQQQQQLDPSVATASHDEEQNHLAMRQHHQQLNHNNEQLAKHYRQTIDKSIGDDEIGLHLRELDLSDNKIDQLGQFDAILDGQELDDETTSSSWSSFMSLGRSKATNSRRFKANELERLAPFLTLTKLQRLNLASNQLVRLNRHVFLGLIHLRHLDLARNQLEYVDKHAFVGLIELETLSLSGNKLASQLAKLHLTLCRAPVQSLRYFDLSSNQKVSSSDVLLPNQMFICAPNLIGLKLDNLQLRYVQVNAFDNLQQLEWLNLSKNPLEQVPSDSLSNSRSNLRQSLKQLDLSDTQIEFVNGNSFGSLKNLQKLFMSFMQKLVSFDLAAFHVIAQAQQRHGAGVDSLAASKVSWEDESFRSTLKNLLPNHLYDRYSAKKNDDDSSKTLGSITSLVNDQLEELHLSNNLRLQSLHSSLANKLEQPRGRMKFARLQVLNLQNDEELRYMPLEEMVDPNGLELPVQVDLSSAGKFNCSSCQMSWLIEAAKQLKRQSAFSQGTGWDLIPFDPFSLRPVSQAPANQQVGERRFKLASNHLIGCTWPFNMPLSELLGLETNFAPLFGHCDAQTTLAIGDESSSSSSPTPVINQMSANGNNATAPNHFGFAGNSLITSAANLPQNQTIERDQLGPTNNSPDASRQPATTMTPASEETNSQVAFSALLSLALILLVIKLVLTLLMRHYKTNGAGGAQSGFKWHQAASVTNCDDSIESPSNSSQNNTAQVDCSSSSILTTASSTAAVVLVQQAANNKTTVFPTAQRYYEQLQQQQQQQQQRLAANHGSMLFGAQHVVGQIERVRNDGAGNLFSRFAKRLRATGWRRRQRSGPSFSPPTQAPHPSQQVYGSQANYLASNGLLVASSLGHRQQQPPGDFAAGRQSAAVAAPAPLCSPHDFIRNAGALYEEANFYSNELHRLQLQQQQQSIIDSTVGVAAGNYNNDCNHQWHQQRQMQVKRPTLQAIESQAPATFLPDTRQAPATSLAATCQRRPLGPSMALGKQVADDSAICHPNYLPGKLSPVSSVLPAARKSRRMSDNNSNNNNNNVDDHDGDQEAHIYVTLDRPIKRKSSGRNCSGDGAANGSASQSGSTNADDETYMAGQVAGNGMASLQWRLDGAGVSSSVNSGEQNNNNNTADNKEAVKISSSKFKLDSGAAAVVGPLSKLSAPADYGVGPPGTRLVGRGPELQPRPQPSFDSGRYVSRAGNVTGRPNDHLDGPASDGEDDSGATLGQAHTLAPVSVQAPFRRAQNAAQMARLSGRPHEDANHGEGNKRHRDNYDGLARLTSELAADDYVINGFRRNEEVEAAAAAARRRIATAAADGDKLASMPVGVLVDGAPNRQQQLLGATTATTMRRPMGSHSNVANNRAKAASSTDSIMIGQRNFHCGATGNKRYSNSATMEPDYDNSNCNDHHDNNSNSNNVGAHDSNNNPKLAGEFAEIRGRLDDGSFAACSPRAQLMTNYNGNNEDNKQGDNSSSSPAPSLALAMINLQAVDSARERNNSNNEIYSNQFYYCKPRNSTRWPPAATIDTNRDRLD